MNEFQEKAVAAIEAQQAKVERRRHEGMERLTYEKSQNRWDEGKHPTKYTSRYTFQEVVARLAAYEDTGLEPEDIDALQKREQGLAEMLVNVSCGCAVPYTRLAELAQAEKDGRLVVLPCKVGDELWMVVTKRAKLHLPEYSFVKKSLLTWNNLRRVLQDFGKTVFPTREEAEAALKKREEADDETD